MFICTDVVLSTVHKAKGLEFSTVKVTDDFTDLHHHFLSKLLALPLNFSCVLCYFDKRNKDKR